MLQPDLGGFHRNGTKTFTNIEITIRENVTGVS